MKDFHFIKKLLLFAALFGCFHLVNAQKVVAVVDSLYLEDQLYLSTGYSFLLKKTSDIRQTGFSGEISAGFIKDIPLNKKRNFGLGVGLGYAYNVYNSSLKINDNRIEVAPTYGTSKLYTNWLEVPLEVRFRTSTPTKYSFFRFYTGVKFSYLLYSKSLFENGSEKMNFVNNSQVRKFQYGLYFAIGYSTFNLYVLYNLQPLFNDNNHSLNVSQLTAGLRFYMF